MSIFFEKARQLGNLIMESDTAIKFKEAQALYNADGEKVKMMEAYNEYRNSVQTAMESGEMEQADFNAARDKLMQMADELKNDSVIGSLIRTENEFNVFVNQIFNVLKVTITGDTESCGGDCGGGCGGCH